MDEYDGGALVEWQLMDGKDRCTPSLGYLGVPATATLTNTNRTWIIFLSMMGLHKKKPVINRLNVSWLFVYSVLCSKAVIFKRLFSLATLTIQNTYAFHYGSQMLMPSVMFRWLAAVNLHFKPALWKSQISHLLLF
jgi:hypothetical protein